MGLGAATGFGVAVGTAFAGAAFMGALGDPFAAAGPLVVLEDLPVGALLLRALTLWVVTEHSSPTHRTTENANFILGDLHEDGMLMR
jgi:hypothetical protein